jgi:2-oxoglutarate dehydrogenase E2 component (dihydrolipoamide succinyltransferase)
VEKMSRMHQLTAANMHRSWLNVPHVTEFDDVDVTELEQFRESLKAEAARRDIKLTPLPFVFRAAAAALRANPRVNASLHADGEQVVYKEYVHIGMAVDTPAGLVVPVVRDVDQKSMAELEKVIADFGARARADKLQLSDLQGGTFTISNGGIFGSMLSTPILNPPQTGILGMHNITERAVVKDGQIVARPMMYLALSYDHRLIDGREAVQFLVRIKECIEAPERLLLEI